MPEAFVLMNTEIGAEREVMKTLIKTEGVQEAFSLSGIYDIIAKVRADTMDRLTYIINEKLKISRVLSKITIMVSER